MSRATALKLAYAGLWAPLATSRPLCHGFPDESRKTNQTNICTLGSAFATVSACLAYLACVAVETPFGSPGFVSWPYSVIQTGTVRWNADFSVFSKVGSVDSVTLG